MDRPAQREDDQKRPEKGPEAIGPGRACHAQPQSAKGRAREPVASRGIGRDKAEIDQGENDKTGDRDFKTRSIERGEEGRELQRHDNGKGDQKPLHQFQRPPGIVKPLLPDGGMRPIEPP